MEALESNYCEIIDKLKVKNKKVKLAATKDKLEKTNSIAITNELNDLFKQCVDTTRREIMRQR